MRHPIDRRRGMIDQDLMLTRVVRKTWVEQGGGGQTGSADQDEFAGSEAGHEQRGTARIRDGTGLMDGPDPVKTRACA